MHREQDESQNKPARAWRRAMWFVTLWIAGVCGALFLALPFRLLVQAAMTAAPP